MRNPLKRVINACNAVHKRYTMPLRLELSITDHCNLNCKGCTHYCPIAPEHHMPLKQLDGSLSHLASIDNTMFKHIYILGGEPLLHPSIADVCRLTRRYFPSAEIKLLTNGIKVNDMDDNFWKACKETDTIISVTIYPVKVDYNAIEQNCSSRDIRYEVFHQPVNGKFFTKHTIDDINPGNKHLNFIRCHQIGCLTLRGNRIYPCATSAYADFINERFGRNFVETPPRDGYRKGDYVEIKKVRTKADLIRLKNHPTPFCRYCTRLEPTTWAPSHRSPSEWL